MKKPRTVYRHHHIILMVVAFLLVVTCLSCDAIRVTQIYEHGVLATASPIATEIGVSVFKKGGNAIDVAVAVGFVLSVTHPEAGNIGGGGFAVVRDGATGEIHALDFRETAPGAATEKMYLDSTDQPIENLSTVGAKAAGVPGTVAGLHELWSRYGSLPWNDLVIIAAELADSGFVVDEYLAASLKNYRSELSQFPSTAEQFVPSGRTPEEGDRFVQVDLAQTLRTIAVEGPEGFYHGVTAALIDSCMKINGGLITIDDLAGYKPVWRQPIHFRFDSLDIYSMPPPSSGGIIVGQILKLLEVYDFGMLSPNSPEYIHLFSEAARLAFADRSKHLGDPEYYDVPAGMLEESYLVRRREQIVEKHAGSSELIQPGLPTQTESDQTTHYSVCDVQGNMVAITYTLNSSYGSMLVVDGAGFLLNNEMDDFSVKPGVPNIYGLIGAEANKIEPGKRMLSSMAPTLILLRERPFMALGSPGGSKIITTVAQAIVGFTRFDQPLIDVVGQPRFHHQWLPDQIYYETGGWDINIQQELIGYGHMLKERSRYGDLQAIYINPGGLMSGASDPRKRGTSGGF